MSRRRRRKRRKKTSKRGGEEKSEVETIRKAYKKPWILVVLYQSVVEQSHLKKLHRPANDEIFPGQAILLFTCLSFMLRNVSIYPVDVCFYFLFSTTFSSSVSPSSCLTTKRTHLIKESIWNFACYFQSVRRLLAYQHLVATLGIVFFSLFVIWRAWMETKRRNDKDDNKQTSSWLISSFEDERSFVCLSVCCTTTTTQCNDAVVTPIDWKQNRRRKKTIFSWGWGAVFSFRLVLAGLTNSDD